MTVKVIKNAGKHNCTPPYSRTTRHYSLVFCMCETPHFHSVKTQRSLSKRGRLYLNKNKHCLSVVQTKRDKFYTWLSEHVLGLGTGYRVPRSGYNIHVWSGFPFPGADAWHSLIYTSTTFSFFWLRVEFGISSVCN